MKKTYQFGKDRWNDQPLQIAYSYRFTETPEFIQNEDHIAGGVNPHHREGFDNISLLCREVCSSGTRVTIHCAFEELGCPEIIFAEQPEVCPDGAVRYGACFEVVLYKNGINVWRHYRDEGQCHWHKRLGWEFPVAEGIKHTLSVDILPEEMLINIDGNRLSLRIEDMFGVFHPGITVCEGIARVYDMTVEPIPLS